MLFKQTVILLLILFLEKVRCWSRTDPLVDTNVGLIRGLTATDGDYAMFLGIPYAKVDDRNPFGVSTPYPNFEDAFEAYDDAAICPQMYNGNIIGTIDCLNLNIYVPSSATSSNPLPVMVWVHGGAFMHGFGTRNFYGPSYLVKHDIILVSINYRLTAYGFMCLDNPEVAGNQGLKDQVLAFQWIKDNIAAFGGDTDKITVFGESAGGHAIDLHLIAPGDKLYDKIILQSASAVARTVLYDPDKAAPLKLAAVLGFETDDVNNALNFLANTEPNLVIAAVNELNLIFKPCVEIQFEGVEPFITSHWINAEAPKVKDMPILLGFNEYEVALGHMNKDSDYYENLDIVSDHLTQLFDFDDDVYNKMKDLVTHFYFGDENMSEATKWSVIQFDSDITYIHPVHRTITNYLESGAGNIYYYMFTYVGGRNALVTDDVYPFDSNMTLCCAAHADELAYLFDMSHQPELTDQDRLVMERMTTMWTNFAKYSHPTPEASELLPVKWMPLTKDTYNYLNIGAEISAARRPLNRRMAFWKLFYKLNEKYERNYVE